MISFYRKIHERTSRNFIHEADKDNVCGFENRWLFIEDNILLIPTLTKSLTITPLKNFFIIHAPCYPEEERRIY